MKKLGTIFKAKLNIHCEYNQVIRKDDLCILLEIEKENQIWKVFNLKSGVLVRVFSWQMESSNE